MSTKFTIGRFLLAVGVVAALFVVIILGVHMNGTDHGPTPEQECGLHCALTEAP